MGRRYSTDELSAEAERAKCVALISTKANHFSVVSLLKCDICWRLRRVVCPLQLVGLPTAVLTAPQELRSRHVQI